MAPSPSPYTPLHSPQNPGKAVNALYKRPMEWGKYNSSVRVRSVPSPTPMVVVLHSPTPSKVNTAALSKGEQEVGAGRMGEMVLRKQDSVPFNSYRLGDEAFHP